MPENNDEAVNARVRDEALLKTCAKSMAAAERGSGQMLDAARGYVAPTKLGATDVLREMLAAIQADDSDRYWKAFEAFIAIHDALLKPHIMGAEPQKPTRKGNE